MNKERHKHADEPPRAHEHRIVAGVDGSACSKFVLEWAARQAELTGAELDVVAAWEWPTTFGWAGPIPGDYDPASDAKGILEEAVAGVAAEHPGVRVTSHAVEGHPAPVLLRMAETAELLVVGSRGHGEFTGMLLGSVSTHCVAHSACPVVVLRSGG